MAIYRYEALKKGKEVVKGEVQASNLKDAKEVVRHMGLVPIKINEVTAKTVKIKQGLSSMSLTEKIDFISTLQILLQSGIPAVQALLFMEQEAARPKIRKVSGIVKTQVIAGSTLADTLARYPDVFGHICIGLVKAGEEAGELEKVLGRINELLTKQSETKAKVIGTLMYPMFVIVLAFIIVLVMLLFVFPAFKEMFEAQDKALPFITAAMINAGDFLKTYWYTIPLFIAAFVIFVIMSIKWKPLREFFDRLVLKIPLLNNLILYSNYSNFLSVLDVSYEAGVPVVDCLHLGVITLTNSLLNRKISGAVTNVQQGLQLSLAFKATKMMPKMLIFMIQTGEETGKLGEMLGKAVNYLDKTLDGIIGTVVKMIEPIMLIVIGSIVLVMALALYLPLFQSYMN